MRIALPIARTGSQRGAMLVPVALALLALTILSAVIVNYGIMVVARNQVQNSVDAAALAGATALAFESHSDPTPGGPAYSAAIALAAENPVWGEAADIADGDIEFSTCPSVFSTGGTGITINECIQVSAYRAERSADRNNAIPTFLSGLLGPWMSVSASATGYARDANVTDCLKPFAIADRWVEHYPTDGDWTPAARFDMAVPPLFERDDYSFPGDADEGTGFTIDAEFGQRVTLTLATAGGPITEIKPWRYLPVQIPGSQWGANSVGLNTASCAGEPIAINRTLNVAIGAAETAVAEALLDLYEADETATWNEETQRVEDSCADAEEDRCGSMSPRIVAVPLYDPELLANQILAGTVTSVRVRNIVGFFISSVDVGARSVTGYITRHPGMRSAGVTLTDGASFLRTSLLVQ